MTNLMLQKKQKTMIMLAVIVSKKTVKIVLIIANYAKNCASTTYKSLYGITFIIYITVKLLAKHEISCFWKKTHALVSLSKLFH